MKKFLMMALILLSQGVGSAQCEVHSAVGPNVVETTQLVAPYTFFLHFPDNSLEICYVQGFSIGYPNSDIQVQNCVGDDIFKDGFE